MTLHEWLTDSPFCVQTTANDLFRCGDIVQVGDRLDTFSKTALARQFLNKRCRILRSDDVPEVHETYYQIQLLEPVNGKCDTIWVYEPYLRLLPSETIAARYKEKYATPV